MSYGASFHNQVREEWTTIRELTAALAAIDDSRPTVSGSRKQLVDSIRGKYRHVPTSSESFMNRKKNGSNLLYSEGSKVSSYFHKPTHPFQVAPLTEAHHV